MAKLRVLYQNSNFMMNKTRESFQKTKKKARKKIVRMYLLLKMKDVAI